MGIQANTTIESLQKAGFVVEVRTVIESQTQTEYDSNEYPVTYGEAAIHFPDADGTPMPLYLREEEEVVYQFIANRNGNNLWWDSNPWGNNTHFTNFARLKGVHIILG